MCFSVLVLIKPSFASVQIYKALFFPKDPGNAERATQISSHSAVVTSPSAIDSSNKCLERAICARNGWQADALERHLEKSVRAVEAGLKKTENKRLYSQPDPCKFVKLIICMIYVCPFEKVNISYSISGTGQPDLCYLSPGRSCASCMVIMGELQVVIDRAAKQAAHYRLIHVQHDLLTVSLRQRGIQIPWFPASVIKIWLIFVFKFKLRSYEVWGSLDQKENPHISSDYKLNITHLLASINEQFSLAWSTWGMVYEHARFINWHFHECNLYTNLFVCSVPCICVAAWQRHPWCISHYYTATFLDTRHVFLFNCFFRKNMKTKSALFPCQPIHTFAHKS